MKATEHRMIRACSRLAGKACVGGLLLALAATLAYGDGWATEVDKEVDTLAASGGEVRRVVATVIAPLAGPDNLPLLLIGVAALGVVRGRQP